MTEFCRHLTNGLIYNNDTVAFTVSPCCYFQGQLRQIKPYQDLEEQLLAHRTAWLKTDTAKSCKICIDAEEQKLLSFRQSSFDTMLGKDNRLEHLTVSVNKKCNLACASCNSWSSSFWYQENTRNGVSSSPMVRQMHQEDKQGQITKRFVELLRKQDLSALRYIRFGGGEPLMSDTHEQILKLIPCPENVTIHYTSNFTVMPSKIAMALWAKFKLVKWVASIDGTKSHFEFLRWPYRWKKLQAFVKRAMAEVPDNVLFGTEHTVNPLNAFYLNEFEDWFYHCLGTNRFGDKSDFNLHICNGILGLEFTPPQLRQLIEQKYGSQHMLTLALNQKIYPGHNGQMVNYLDKLDSWRGTEWRKIFAEVQDFFHA